MTVKDFETLFDYGYWANRKLFAVLTDLTDEQFTEVVAGGYGSVRNTLVHVLSAEWGWLDRCGGTPRGPSLVAADYPTVASVRDRMGPVRDPLVRRWRTGSPSRRMEPDSHSAPPHDVTRQHVAKPLTRACGPIGTSVPTHISHRAQYRC